MENEICSICGQEFNLPEIRRNIAVETKVKYSNGSGGGYAKYLTPCPHCLDKARSMAIAFVDTHEHAGNLLILRGLWKEGMFEELKDYEQVGDLGESQ